MSIKNNGIIEQDNEPYRLKVAKGEVPNTINFEKYGKNSDVDTASTPEDIWNGSGLYTGQPVSDVETMEIFSSDANDTSAGTGARTVCVYNLLDGTGAEMPNIIVSLNGTTPVSLGAGTYLRGGSRIRVLTAGSGGQNAGEITLRHTTTTANIFAVMPTGLNSTAISAWTVPLGKTLYVNRLNCQLSRSTGADGSAGVSFRARESGGVYQAVVNPEITTAVPYDNNDIYFAYEALTDLVWRCDSVSDNNSIISAEFAGFLIDN